MITFLKDNVYRALFLGSSLLVLILWFIIDRKGRTISKLKSDAQLALIQQKLEDIHVKSKFSDKKFEEAKSEYEGLKRTHGDLLKRLGVLDEPPTP